MIIDTIGTKDYMRNKAKEILDNLSDKEIDLSYGSALKDNGGLKNIKTTQRILFITHTKRTLEIDDDYASQVFHRYTLKQINALLQNYINCTAFPVQKHRAEEYSNIIKNIERVYSSRKDDELFDSLVRRVTYIIFSSLSLSKEKGEEQTTGITRDLSKVSILEITKLAELKEKRLLVAAEKIQGYTFGKKK